jgi:hypothetical protein
MERSSAIIRFFPDPADAVTMPTSFREPGRYRAYDARLGVLEPRAAVVPLP